MVGTAPLEQRHGPSLQFLKISLLIINFQIFQFLIVVFWIYLRQNTDWDHNSKPVLVRTSCEKWVTPSKSFQLLSEAPRCAHVLKRRPVLDCLKTWSRRSAHFWTKPASLEAGFSGQVSLQNPEIRRYKINQYLFLTFPSLKNCNCFHKK